MGDYCQVGVDSLGFLLAQFVPDAGRWIVLVIGLIFLVLGVAAILGRRLAREVNKAAS